MPKYKVVAPIQHDGEVFVPGETLSASNVGGQDSLNVLVMAGAVEVEQEADVAQEPPVNYREPDLRLGTGDPSAPGAFKPAIDLPTPTNVPQAGLVDRQPIPTVAPQVEVFKKMARLAEESATSSKQPTLEDQQAERDKEQAAAAKQATKAQQGGEQSVQKAQKAAAASSGSPATVTPTKEQPSPAMATGPSQPVAPAPTSEKKDS
jgi:hypothetical protein